MDNIFITNTNLILKENRSNLTQEDIFKSIPFDFKGKKDFIDFYSLYNGIVFPCGAFLYRDSFYEVSTADYNMLDIGAFFEISDSNNSIIKIWESLKEDIRIKKIISKYLPFANDSSGNMYCIESNTGVIMYLQHETPENIIEVAPSFLDFCNKIQGEMR
jgi:hypothetical protein